MGPEETGGQGLRPGSCDRSQVTLIIVLLSGVERCNAVPAQHP